ncbi:MAG TPA: hypothetical protein VN088_14145 [Nocardioides sp.]|nr:hypothetical protein [Nocardioides sp.]
MSPMEEELEGVVEVTRTAEGSRSEMTSVVLVTDAGETLVLHRRAAVDGGPLSADPTLAAYDGRRVRVTGERTWSGFLVDLVRAAAAPS